MTRGNAPRRGEVWWVAFDPAIGGEIRKDASRSHRQRKAMADQLSTISKLRLRDRIGSLTPEDMAAVERAICVQLGL